jgi:hypothetical protein
VELCCLRVDHVPRVYFFSSSCTRKDSKIPVPTRNKDHTGHHGNGEMNNKRKNRGGPVRLVQQTKRAPVSRLNPFRSQIKIYIETCSRTVSTNLLNALRSVNLQTRMFRNVD